ncbi:alpha/beta fold hydrolase [Rhizobium sp. S152]|uniref:alpha/beta fold hydrolase n=1 Tax=Rhizobium sp. S152 TaxID=3055038 RepID=UPI0025A9CFC4|nr:alpha/beta fold hydrolase [Rhizobium sp. S152]MDM9628775.1 alpha/beta fold hydrolase [Rhizobium sp. S152]
MPDNYIVCARKREGTQFTAEPGPIKFLKVPSNVAVYDERHIVTSAKDWVSEVQGLADGDENPNSIGPTGDVLVFVHGYNNDIPSVLKRIRQLRKDMRAEGWHGEIVAFDWPSDNQTLNYLEDRSDAAAVASELVSKGIRLLSTSQKAGCETNVHLLGHSTGCYVIMEAFAQSDKKGDLFKSDWRIGQVAFIGGDVSADSLSLSSDWNQPMFRRIMRLTNYSNPFDAVLAVSNAKRLGVAPRVGRVGLPKNVNAKAINVNCGEYFKTVDPNSQPQTGSWTHSWHIGNRVFARDLAMTLEGAIDRHAIPTRHVENGELILQDAPRPSFQLAWDIKADTKLAARI